MGRLCPRQIALSPQDGAHTAVGRGQVLLPTCVAGILLCQPQVDREFLLMRRLCPYGDNGGWPWFHLMMMKGGAPIPVHPDAPNVFNPIHEDDYIAQVPKLLELASLDTTTLNWGGEAASIEQCVTYVGSASKSTPRMGRD